MSQQSYPSIERALASMGKEVREVFLEHVDGGTSANFLSDWLTRAGHPVSSTVLKGFRRSRNVVQ
jgi:hypothetical protein